MQLIPLKTKQVQPGDDLMVVIDAALSEHQVELKTGDILVIASKIVAYSQGLLKSIDSKTDFRALIKTEADQVLDEGEMVLTMKNRILIPNAGIDNSNTPEGEVVLWPEKPFEAAQNLRAQLQKKYPLNSFGVLISDSHCQPLRMGTSGIAIGWAGFEGVQDERGAEDLFGRKMQYTRIAVADNLASATTLLMGETNARIPMVLVRGFDAQFTDQPFTEFDYFITPQDCLYKPLYGERLLEV